MWSKEYKLLKAENRIALLSERGKENGRVVAKLKRQIRNLQKEIAAGGPEIG